MKIVIKKNILTLFVLIILINSLLIPPILSNSSAQKIGSNDESVHEKKYFGTQEWWYFNAVFNSEDSELENWSIMVSFNIQKNFDLFFFTLYDDEDGHYGGSIGKAHGAVKAEQKPGLNVCFENSSYASGYYPDWYVHVEDEKLSDKNITCDLNYKTTSNPHWIFANTGINKTKSPLGHYSILNCTVNGTIKIDNKSYYVEGVGYHEHHWFTFLKQSSKQMHEKDFEKSLDVWYWYCLYLDNGYSMFIGDIFQKSKLNRIIPNILFLTKDGRKFSECYYFKIDFLEMENTSIDSIKIPSKVRVRAFFYKNLLKMNLKEPLLIDLIIENKNICENAWVESKTGLWEGSCIFNGKMKSLFNKENFSGRGIVEISKNTI